MAGSYKFKVIQFVFILKGYYFSSSSYIELLVVGSKRTMQGDSNNSKYNEPSVTDSHVSKLSEILAIRQELH
jgi:hypothetical protein